MASTRIAAAMPRWTGPSWTMRTSWTWPTWRPSAPTTSLARRSLIRSIVVARVVVVARDVADDVIAHPTLAGVGGQVGAGDGKVDVRRDVRRQDDRDARAVLLAVLARRGGGAGEPVGPLDPGT